MAEADEELDQFAHPALRRGVEQHLYPRRRQRARRGRDRRPLVASHAYGKSLAKSAPIIHQQHPHLPAMWESFGEKGALLPTPRR